MNANEVLLLSIANHQANGRSIPEWCKAVYENAKAHGWWENERNDGEMIALMHSELSEALEAIRNGNPPCPKDPAMSTLEEEMADVVIRVMDFCYARGINLERAIQRKHAVNVARPYKHGGKKFAILLPFLLCTSLLLGGEAGAGLTSGSGTPEAAPIVQNQQPNQPQPYEQIAAGMAPLEVASILGLESLVEVSGHVFTMTWWRDNTWVTVVFVNFQCVSKSRGSTKPNQ